MFKVVKARPFSPEAWKTYTLWRNYGFSSFESIDSTLRDSQFEVKEDKDWEFALTIGDFLTDVITDLAYAREYCSLREGTMVVGFDYADIPKGNREILGYDILDGQMNYSLLTNFGNDIKRINAVLSKNALIRHYGQAQDVHKWLLKNMGSDNHVMGSAIVSVYGSV